MPGMNVRVVHFSDGCQFLTSLTDLQPSHVVLLEPHLHLMRSLEVHSAERQHSNSMEVLLIRYQESTELYQHMSTIENEKRSFQELISIK